MATLVEGSADRPVGGQRERVPWTCKEPDYFGRAPRRTVKVIAMTFFSELFDTGSRPDPTDLAAFMHEGRRV
jgi:hypothetical protein